MPPSQPSRLDRRFDSSQLGDFARSVRVDKTARGALLGGLIAGLLLGLLVGWVLWPVEWTNANPGDLRPEYKADFLAAVADAYVAVRTPEALDLARQRLVGFGDDQAREIEAALQHFAAGAQRDNAIRITNLQELATALGLDVRPPSVEPAAEGDGGVGWGAWLLLLLLVVALIAAAIYLLRRSNSARWVGGAAPDEMDEREPVSARSTPRMTYTPAYADVDMSTDEAPRTVQDDDLDDQFSYGELVADSEAEDDEEVVRSFEDPVFDDDTVDTGFPIGRAEPEQTPAGSRSYAEPADAAVQRTVPPAAPGPATRNRPIEAFTAYYQMGVPDYDQTFNIADPDGAGYLGECGMGINLKNGILQNSSDYVIAFDVWLFDKADERQMNTQTRILICEYVVDNNLEQVFAKERESEPPPIVAQPGVSFKLEGRNLVLDCLVSEAVYSKNPTSLGVFQSLKVDMTVLRRR